MTHIDNSWREICININVLYYSNLKETWKTWTFCGITVCSDLFYFRFCVKLNVWTRKTLFQDKFIPLTSWGTYKWHLTRATTQANQEDLNWWSWDFRFLKILKLHLSDKLELSLYKGNLENVHPLYCLWDTFNCEIDCNWTCSCNCKEKSTSEKIPDDDGYDFFN